MLTAESIIKKSDDGTWNVLNGVSLTLESGKITTLIGPSGSGKTTMLRALSMLDLPDAGSIRVDKDSYSFPLAQNTPAPAPWPHVTAVFQQLFLWPHLTLKENILLPVRKHKNKKAASQLDKLIEQFDMADFIDRYPNQTSGGQRQRAAIARAVILRPKYLLLDEITSALDVEQTQKILTCLEGLKNDKIGILLITHLINFAQRSSDSIAFMDGGKIVESGGKEVLKKPKSPRLKKFLSIVEAAR